MGAAVVVQSGCLLVAAGAVAGAGTVVYAHGELDASLGNGYESVNRAANRAVDRLQFKKISESKDALTAVLKARTADDTKIEIKITKVTNVLTKVEIRVGAAADSLEKLVAEGVAPFDLIFIDADKGNNPLYVQWALKLARKGTVIIVDNVIRDGAVLEADSTDTNIVGTRRMFELVGKEPRLTATALQTVGGKGYDGFVMAVVSGV